MRYIGLIFLFIGSLIFSNVNAQDIFPDESQQQIWEYVTWNFWGGWCERRTIKNGAVESICEGNYIQILDCDENEQNCHRIGYYRIQGDSVLVREVGYWNGTNYVDSVDCSKPYGLMYDFGSEVNDTIQCAMNTSYAPFQKVFWVHRQEIELFEGRPREVRTLRYQAYPNSPGVIYSMKWVEGIGSNVHPFYSLGCIGDHCEQEQQVTQVFRNNRLIYSDTILTFSFPCNDWVTSVESHQHNLVSLSIRPNPANSWIEVHGSKEVKLDIDLTIYDQLGKVVLEKRKVNTGARLTIEDLPAGLYVVKMRFNKVSYTQKLIVQ